MGKKTKKKFIAGSSTRSRSHHSSRSRSHHSSSQSNKINNLSLRKIIVQQNEAPGSQLKNIKRIFDDSYKCYSINKLEGRVVQKWLNWLLPIKPDEKQEYKSIDCPYGELLMWTVYQLLDNNLLEKYKNGYFFLRQMFSTLEENNYTGIFKVTKKYKNLYNKLKETDDLKKIFYNNYPDREKQYGKNHITISNTGLVALVELLYEKKID